jgi:ribosomal protein RSM22 (predicted rRNA methylase)
LVRESERFPQLELVAAAKRLSDAYRVGTPIRLSRPIDLTAYLLTRMPATFAALYAVFRELPNTPSSLLDFGAGPGTSLWAANAVFGSVEKATLIEQNTNWLAVAERFGLTGAKWRNADIRRLTPPPERHDVTVLSYVVNELELAEGDRLLRRAWEATGSALVLVEPGTPAGFARILCSRDVLLEEDGVHIAAPCPHANDCPLESPDWCHFAVRVERSRAHRLAKGGELGYEDEKFSYLIATREPPQTGFSRILRHPAHAPGRVDLRLCTAEGLTNLSVRKKCPQWKRARKIDWGERWPDSEPAEPESDSHTE